MRFAPLILALSFAACSGAAEEKGAQAGFSAYQQSRVADAERIFAAVAADPDASPGDKAAAHRETARIRWLIDRDEKKALAALDSAEAAGEGVCSAILLRDRIWREAGRPELVLAALPAQRKKCTDPASIEEIALEGADAALALAVRGDAAGLDRARALVAEAGDDGARSLAGSALRLEIGLLAGDGDSALQAWKDYFWLSDSDTPQGIAGPASALFASGAAAAASPEARLALVDLLVRAGFARAAGRFAARHRLGEQAAAHPLWRKASAYFDGRRRLEETILASNRRVARGGKAADLGAAVRAMEDGLIAAAGLRGDRKRALRDSYGLYGTVGDTGGFASVHLGHVVQDERRAIEQYGHRADVALLVIDNMLSNGYESWLWDGSAAAGGWTADGPVIVQVRPGYTSGPLLAWRLVSDPEARRDLLARQKEKMAAERAALADSDVAYLPALADRLRLQYADEVLAAARARAGEGGDLRRAFLDEAWRASFDQSIFVHEGRHALDKKLVTGLARMNDTNLEYRAKLSELALAAYPRLAMFNIDAGTIGGGTPHGNANGKIMKAYAAWIDSNRQAVPGFDPAVPAMMQIDRLSNDQIRAIARSLDPIAR